MVFLTVCFVGVWKFSRSFIIGPKCPTPHTSPNFCTIFLKIETFILEVQVRRLRKLSFFSPKRRHGCDLNPDLFRFKEKYLMLYTSSIQSQRLYCFPVEAAGIVGRLVHTSGISDSYLQYSKRQGSWLLQVSDTHTPYTSQLYCDVLHEGITIETLSSLASKGNLPPKMKRFGYIIWGMFC